MDYMQKEFIIMCNIYEEEEIINSSNAVFDGPATVRMISNNGPPLPMPMQVPPGHMVQQIIDENGILTNVILSSQPPPIAPSPVMLGYYGVGGHVPPHHMYPPYGPPHYGGNHYSHNSYYGPNMNHFQHHVRMCNNQPMHHCQPPIHPHMPPMPPNMNSSSGPHITEERFMGRGKGRIPHGKSFLKYKAAACRTEYPLPPQYPGIDNTRPHGPFLPKTYNGSNILAQSTGQSSSASSDNQDLDEDHKALKDCLTRISPPKVSDIEARCALIVLTPPDLSQLSVDIEPTEVTYELELSEKNATNFNTVYSGDATEITLRDLKPATEYLIKVRSIVENISGASSDKVLFVTLGCQPESPNGLKLLSKTSTSLTIKWNPAVENGAPINNYILECDMNEGKDNFKEIFRGIQRQFKLTKLNPATSYTFRLTAENLNGKSEFSKMLSFSTSGIAPPQPDPPYLHEATSSSLAVVWARRSTDQLFTLSFMDESQQNKSFLSIYHGAETSHTVSNLRRCTDYKFKLQASNDDRNSEWSEVVVLRTLADKPSPPLNLRLKEPPLSRSFNITWDPPKDNGGSDIIHYNLQIDSGKVEVMDQNGKLNFLIGALLPGRTYHARVSAVNCVAQSEWSLGIGVTMLSEPPGPCLLMKVVGKPFPNMLHLKWAYPEEKGGCPILESEVCMLGTDIDNTVQQIYCGPDNQCSVNGLQPGHTYRFKVRFSNKIGAGPWSEIFEIMSGVLPPDAPEQLFVVCQAANTACISWVQPKCNGAPISEYQLEYQKTDMEFTQIYCGTNISTEVCGLMPASIYNFRVQARNSAGYGAYSQTVSCTTLASHPGPVTNVQASSTANQIYLTWRQPVDNGSRILAYYVVVDDHTPVYVEANVLEYVVEDLMPDTTYRIRIQASNAIGLGPFSSSVKITTRSLPPRPPSLECAIKAHNSLKLKWRILESSNDVLQYCVEMLKDDGNFHLVYRGAGHFCKVSRLNELSEYDFRISASNISGSGPYSDIFRFSTGKAPPSIIKSPKVGYITVDSCSVDWPAIKIMGRDSIFYILQMQAVFGRDQTFKEIYRGPSNAHRIDGLQAESEYRLRVCAVRQSKEPFIHSEESLLFGPFSQTTAFVTPTIKASPRHTSAHYRSVQYISTPKWSDQQWAIILLVCFAIFAILVAFLAQQIIATAQRQHNIQADVGIKQYLPNHDINNNITEREL